MTLQEWLKQQTISRVSTGLFVTRIVLILLVVVMVVLVTVKYANYTVNKVTSNVKDISRFSRARIQLSDTSLGSNVMITGSSITADCSPESSGKALLDNESLVSWQYTFSSLDDIVSGKAVWTSFVDNVSTLTTSLIVPTYRYGAVYVRVAASVNPDNTYLILGNAKGPYKFNIKPNVTWSGAGVESMALQKGSKIVWTYTSTDNTIVSDQSIDVYYRSESSDTYSKATNTVSVDTNAYTATYTLDDAISAGYYYFKLSTNNMVAKGFASELEFELNELVEVTSGVQSLSSSAFGTLTIKSTDGASQTIYSPNETLNLIFTSTGSYSDLVWSFSADKRVSWQVIGSDMDSPGDSEYSRTWTIPSNVPLNTRIYIRVADSTGSNTLESFFTVKMYIVMVGDTKEEVLLDDYKDRQDVLGYVARSFNLYVYGYNDIQTLQDPLNWYVGWVTLKNTLNNATGMTVTSISTSNITKKKVFCRLTVNDQGALDLANAVPLYFRFSIPNSIAKTIEYTSNRTYSIVMT
jgi:hypothetical protein